MEKPSKEEQIGIHKGALSVLAAEQNELIRMVNVTQQLAQVHMKALKELGVDLAAEMKKAQESMQKQTDKKKEGDALADRLG